MNRRNIIKALWASLFGGAAAAYANSQHNDMLSPVTVETIIGVTAALKRVSRFSSEICCVEYRPIDPKDEGYYKRYIESMCAYLNIENEWLGWGADMKFYGSKMGPGLGHRIKFAGLDS